jgi:hypothetical protein
MAITKKYLLKSAIQCQNNAKLYKINFNFDTFLLSKFSFYKEGPCHNVDAPNVEWLAIPTSNSGDPWFNCQSEEWLS